LFAQTQLQWVFCAADAISVEMKQFTFTLETLRRIRKQEEQLVQLELAEALRDRTAIADKLNTSLQAEQDLYAYMRSGQLDARELRHISRFDELHRQRIVDATVELKFQDDAVGRVRERLKEARVKREALERLKVKQKERHTALQLAEQQRELDEIATQRAARAAMAVAA
jgi:flagellar export protein FliJ